MPSDVLLDHGCRRRSADSLLTQQQAAAEKEKCPRCESRDTKFCYYNNYNTSQPRHFCRSCRRYWTLGGSLRNVPIGGGSSSSRNKRLRPNPPTTDRHVPVSQLTGAGALPPFEPPPFWFDLGLGLGSMKAAAGQPDMTGPSAIEGMGFGMGPAALAVWPFETWRLPESGGGGASAVLSGEFGGGLAHGDQVH